MWPRRVDKAKEELLHAAGDYLLANWPLPENRRVFGLNGSRIRVVIEDDGPNALVTVYDITDTHSAQRHIGNLNTDGRSYWPAKTLGGLGEE